MSAIFESKADRRCPVCLTEWSSAALKFAGIKGCPKCKTALAPLHTAEDGYIKINWQDVRVLVLYANRWAKVFDETKRVSLDALMALKNITMAVQQYRPATGALLIPEQDIVTIEKEIKTNRKGDVVIELTIKHKEDEKQPDPKLASPYFINLQ